MPLNASQKTTYGLHGTRLLSIHNKATQEYVDKVGLAIADDIVMLRMKAQQAGNVVQQLRGQYERHMLGFANDEESQKMRAFFESGNKTTLDNLIKKFH